MTTAKDLYREVADFVEAPDMFPVIELCAELISVTNEVELIENFIQSMACTVIEAHLNGIGKSMDKRIIRVIVSDDMFDGVFKASLNSIIDTTDTKMKCVYVASFCATVLFTLRTIWENVDISTYDFPDCAKDENTSEEVPSEFQDFFKSKGIE